MRLEKPHSLSYHAATRHSLPSTTWVWVRSKMELAGLWLKSADTSGASLTVRIPLSRLPLAARRIALLISSAVVLRLATKLRSTIETLAVGTRIAVPSSRPLSSGSTRPTALAAPVEVGIIDIAAARARRLSVCSVSTMRWSLV